MTARAEGVIGDTEMDPAMDTDMAIATAMANKKIGGISRPAAKAVQPAKFMELSHNGQG